MVWQDMDWTVPCWGMTTATSRTQQSLPLASCDGFLIGVCALHEAVQGDGKVLHLDRVSGTLSSPMHHLAGLKMGWGGM